MSELNFMHENIPGIYNYSDRWCEKCSYTNRCLLFKKEAKREIKHLLKNENESDAEHYSKLVVDEMEDMEKLFGQNSNSEDFLDSLDDNEDFDFDDEDGDLEKFDEEDDNEIDNPEKSFNPLIHLSEEMFSELEVYYDTAKKHFPEEIEKYDTTNPLITNMQILSWYIPQISVKIRMCFWGKKQLEKAKGKITREVEEEMLNVTSRIVYLGIEKSLAALNGILLQQKELEIETQLFLSTIKMIKKMFLEEFPKGQSYKRPYFD